MIRLTLIIMLVASVAPARADDAADAAAFADEGERLVDAGRLTEACPQLEASLALVPDDLQVRESLASCREDLGQLATAWTLWRDLKARARAAGLTQLAVIATDHLIAIEPRLAHLTLRWSTDATPPDGATVALDGAPVADDALGGAVAIDQGTHRITADAPGFATWALELFVENGAFKTVELGPLVPATELPPPEDDPSVQLEQPLPDAPAPAPSQTRAWVGRGVAAAGVVIVAVGVWAALDARSHRDDAQGLGCNHDLSSCPPGGALDAANTAYARANLSTVMTIGGAVAIAGGVVLWLYGGEF